MISRDSGLGGAGVTAEEWILDHCSNRIQIKPSLFILIDFTRDFIVRFSHFFGLIQ